MAGMSVAEVEVGARALPQPTEPDLHAVLPFVTGSLFHDIDTKAAFWQRARVTPSGRVRAQLEHPATQEGAADAAPMLQCL